MNNFEILGDYLNPTAKSVCDGPIKFFKVPHKWTMSNKNGGFGIKKAMFLSFVAFRWQQALHRKNGKFYLYNSDITKNCKVSMRTLLSYVPEFAKQGFYSLTKMADNTMVYTPTDKLDPKERVWHIPSALIQSPSDGGFGLIQGWVVFFILNKCLLKQSETIDLEISDVAKKLGLDRAVVRNNLSKLALTKFISFSEGVCKIDLEKLLTHFGKSPEKCTHENDIKGVVISAQGVVISAQGLEDFAQGLVISAQHISPPLNPPLSPLPRNSLRSNATSQDSPSGRLAHGSKSESESESEKNKNKLRCVLPRCARSEDRPAASRASKTRHTSERVCDEQPEPLLRRCASRNSRTARAIAVSLRSTAIPRNSTLDIPTGIGSNQDTRDTLPTSPLRVSVGTESESSLENQSLLIDSKPKPWTLCQEAGSGEKEETGLSTKRRRSADLTKTGDVARLDRFRRRAKGQTPSAATHKSQDLSVDLHRAISSGDPDASTHTSGHLDLKHPKTSNSYESDISHLPGRKEDQRMESMSTPSQAPLSRIEQMKKDLTIQKMKEAKNNPSQKKRTKEELAWKVLHFWNEQENLRTHRVKNPLSKTVKQSLALIEDAFKGKLHVDHDKSFPGRKFNYRNFTTAISKVNEVAIDPVFGKAQKWASELSLRNFLKNQSPIFCKDPDSDFALRNLSPFLFFVDHDMEEQSFRVVGPNYDEKLISDVHDIIRESYDKVFPYNEENKKDVVRFIKYVDDFIKENKNGLAADTTIKGIAREYCSFVFEENFNHKIGFLFFANKHSEFFDHCLEMGILYDEYKGRLFKNGSKFFFQLTDAERKAIKNKEKKAKEEQERISEERRIADQKQRKEELLKNPPKPYDPKAEMEKKKRKQDVKSCTARKDEWRKKAKAKGNAKEFDAIWFDWARETKIDPSKLDQLKQSIQHLL